MAYVPFLAGLFPATRPPKRARRPRRRPSLLRLERLESRELLAVSPTDVTLKVNLATGDALLSFNVEQTISGYEIDSASAQFLTDNWQSLTAAGYPDWFELFKGPAYLSEGTLSGPLTHVGSISLGNIFPVGGVQDLFFNWIDNDGNFYSPDVEYVTGVEGTATTLTTSVNPSKFGQSVTFTATVTATTVTPAGTVTFFDGAVSLGTATLNGSGQATLALAALGVGDHVITAQYGGSAEAAASTSDPLTQTVDPAGTTTGLTASTLTPGFGETVTLTANVSVTAPGAGTPTGNVVFYDGATELGTVVLNGAGQAVLSTASLASGPHSLFAFYAGDGSFDFSNSDAVSVTVSGKATTTALAASASKVFVGDTVTLTATVQGTGGTPTGTVDFYDGATLLTTVTLDGAGVAVYATSALSAGPHSLTAVYSGDGNFNQSTSSAANVRVYNLSDQPAVAITTATNPAVVGQPVTLNVAVTGPNGFASGTVSLFTAGDVLLATVTLNASGQASYVANGLPLGATEITGTYSGDATYAPTATPSPLTVNVVQAATTTALASQPAAPGLGQTVTLTATIAITAPGSGTLTGSVQFLDGATVLGTATVTGGTASLQTSALALGNHSLTAVYSGDSNFTGSTSAAVDLTVKGASTTTLSASAASVVEGSSVTLTGAVSATGTTPTGSINFYDGATLLATVALDASGQATYSTTALAVGNHALKATYAGSDVLGSSESGTVNVSVTAKTTPTPTPPATWAFQKVYGGGSFRGRGFFSLVAGAASGKTPTGYLVVTLPSGNGLSRRSVVTATSFSTLSVNAAGDEATLTGSARLNGRSGYTFTAVVDAQHKAWKTGVLGSFSITLHGPGGFRYSGGGTMGRYADVTIKTATEKSTGSAKSAKVSQYLAQIEAFRSQLQSAARNIVKSPARTGAIDSLMATIHSFRATLR